MIKWSVCCCREYNLTEAWHITFASLSPSSVFTTLSAAMSDCKTAVGRRKTSQRSQIHHAVSYNDAPSCQPARPPFFLFGSCARRLLSCSSFFRLDDMSESLPLAEEQHSHRPTPPVLLLSQQTDLLTSMTVDEGESPPEGASGYVSNEVARKFAFSSPAALWRKWEV